MDLMTSLVTGVAKSFKLLLTNGNTATFAAYVKKFNNLPISGSINWA